MLPSSVTQAWLSKEGGFLDIERLNVPTMAACKELRIIMLWSGSPRLHDPLQAFTEDHLKHVSPVRDSWSRTWELTVLPSPASPTQKCG